VNCLNQCYDDSLLSAEDFDKPLIPSVLPSIRRAMFDQRWRLLAEKYDFTANYEPNANKCYSYTVIRTPRIWLTAHYVERPDAPVRPAVYRENLCGESTLWDDIEMEVGSRSTSSFYAMLTHSGAYAKLESARIVFPKNQSEYHTETINLMDLQGVRIVGEERNTDQAFPRLRDRQTLADQA
jgi:hypothetical protein